jgi:integrase
MAYVRQHPNSKFWTACFRNEHGRWIRRSTKETDETKAREISRTWEAAHQEARNGHLVKERVTGVIDALFLRISDGKESLFAPPANRYFKDWFQRRKADGLAEGSLPAYRKTIELFLEFLGKRVDEPISKIKLQDIEEFLRTRTKNCASATIVLSLSILKTAFADAIRHGMIERNPCLHVRVPSGAEAATRQTFSIEELRTLVQHSSGDWKTAILLGLYTGGRLGDLANLKWHQINLNEGIITYKQSKTGKTVVVPMHPVLESYFKTLAPTNGTIMPKFAGRPTHTLSDSFLALMKKAGIDSVESTRANGRIWRAKTFHSLRHSAETLLAKANVSAELRRNLVGRNGEGSQRIYTHHDFQDLLGALTKLPDVL